LRLRPIVTSTLAATIGLLPATLSHAIGFDSQRPFAIVIAGGPMVAIAMNVVLLPAVHLRMMRQDNRLHEPDMAEDV